MYRLRQRLSILIVFAALALTSTATAAENVEALRVHVLDCGAMNGIPADELLAEVPDRPEKLDLVNRCFLIEHPQGRLLWDTGFPHSFGFGMKMFAFSLTSLWRSGVESGDPLPEQLEAIGLGVEDIDWLALSHIHWDHAGGSNDFAASKWIVQQRDLDWAFNETGKERPHVDQALYQKLESAQKHVLQGEDFDVFGDGSVVVLSAPGHTPGHQCLYLDLPETGPIVLSGDLYHSRMNREYRAPPSFNTDAAETRVSMERIETFLRERGADIWIQHAPDSGPTAPAIMD